MISQAQRVGYDPRKLTPATLWQPVHPPSNSSLELGG